MWGEGEADIKEGKERRKAVESERAPLPSLAPLCKNKVCKLGLMWWHVS